MLVRIQDPARKLDLRHALDGSGIIRHYTVDRLIAIIFSMKFYQLSAACVKTVKLLLSRTHKSMHCSGVIKCP